MKPVGEHPVPAGPLAVPWLAFALEPPRAGAITTAYVALENAGSATWRADAGGRVELSYHWLDDRGNPILWEGLWKPLGRPIEPGERIETDMEVRAPTPPGRYTLALDLVDEGRYWFSELGNRTLEVPVEVTPRLTD